MLSPRDWDVVIAFHLTETYTLEVSEKRQGGGFVTYGLSTNANWTMSENAELPISLIALNLNL